MGRSTAFALQRATLGVNPPINPFRAGRMLATPSRMEEFRVTRKGVIMGTEKTVEEILAVAAKVNETGMLKA